MRKGGKVYEFRVHSADPAASPPSQAPAEEATDRPDGTATPNEHQARIDKIKREFADRFVTELPPNQAGPQAPEIAETEPDFPAAFHSCLPRIPKGVGGNEKADV